MDKVEVGECRCLFVGVGLGGKWSEEKVKWDEWFWWGCLLGGRQRVTVDSLLWLIS